MLKRMSIKKIMVSTAAVLLLLIIYLIPDNRKEIELKNKDIEDGKRIADIFATLSEENKNMAIVYLSALRDKEIADSSKKEVN